MAIREIMESDLSGKPDAATVSFGLGNTWYEIDLTDEEKAKLEQALASYVHKARKANRAAGTPTPRTRTWPKTSREFRAQVRAWAMANGQEVSEFGRIPVEVLDAYREAHPESELEAQPES